MWITVKDDYGSQHTFDCAKITLCRDLNGRGWHSEEKWKILFWGVGNNNGAEFSLFCKDKAEAEFKYAVFHAELTEGKFIELPSEQTLYYGC